MSDNDAESAPLITAAPIAAGPGGDLSENQLPMCSAAHPPLTVCKPCFGTLCACRINPLLRTFIPSCARPRRPIRTRPIQYR